MSYSTRILGSEVLRAAKAFPALLLTGPRRAGKTTLLRKVFPKAQYHLLEDPDLVERIQSDPRSFLESLRLPVILDEIQNTPELPSYIRSLIDQDPGKVGGWLLTGSQEAPLMQGISESMAGRAAVFQLLPFSVEEHRKVSLLHGGYPEVLQQPDTADLWFNSYLQTYLERDVRALTNVRDLATFRRFIAVLATRHGQLLNRSELAAPLGITVPTINQWLSILEVTGLLTVVQPYYENFGKRLLKSPKVYFNDSGLVCHLLGIRDTVALESSPFLGALFEGWVASEISKARLFRSLPRNLYFFRDRQGLEVDFLLDRGNGRLCLLEAKSTRTPRPRDGLAMQKLLERMPDRAAEAFVIHRVGNEPEALTEGVRHAGIHCIPGLAL